MTIAFRTLLGGDGPINCELLRQTHYTKERADWANKAFDLAVKQFLREWIDHGMGPDKHPDRGADSDAEAFVEHGALRSFFKHSDDALERLLQKDTIARHLLRPLSEVYFENDAYEPMLAQFEKRIYNLAAHREHREIPFRYSPPSRQCEHGDTVGLFDGQTGLAKEDIGTYFGTRRSDTTALTILANQLQDELNAKPVFQSQLPVHVVTEGYMEDSLRIVLTVTQQLQEEGNDQLQCFVIQRRHAADDRHLGAALLVMNPQQPELPQRIIFCDTLNPSGTPPWWDKFKQKVDAVFPQLDGSAPASDRMEDGGVNLQRLHDGVPVRHQDIDCAFYTASMVRALIQLAQSAPDVILTGSISEVVSEMTARMPEYFEWPNQPKDPVSVREENIARRWNTGRDALQNLMGAKIINIAVQEPEVYSVEVA